MNKITQEHIIELYEEFKSFFKNNSDNFQELSQTEIINVISQNITLQWTKTSLNGYIINLIHMFNGEKFKWTINNFAETYFIGNICKDFDENICANSKFALMEHKKYYKNVANKEDKSKENNEKESIKTKNIILYGTAGVGKTHNYQRLISMIEEGKDEKEIFDTITNNKDENEIILDNKFFKSIKDDGRVEFVTFHQSYSYEDFIEGLRPNDKGGIDHIEGIFKEIADRADENLKDSKKSKQEIKILYNFQNLLDEFKLYVEDKISEGEFILKGKATITEVSKSSFSVGGSVSSGQKLTFNIIERDYQEFKNGTIKTYQDVKSTFESKRGVHGNAPYYFALYKKLKDFEKNYYKNSNTNIDETIKKKNYYIVIDEINRGNISKIFGELITLIEEDKRDSYEVTLQYSKEKFKVPSNLYIIATMNSSDKSIATIDIALRRRFTFLKMLPNLALVKNNKAQELMKELNIYIKNTIGEDYMLGHSYFMKVETDEDLNFIKKYKIKPLLEEYFYGDEKSLKEVLKIVNPVEKTDAKD